LLFQVAVLHGKTFKKKGTLAESEDYLPF